MTSSEGWLKGSFLLYLLIYMARPDIHSFPFGQEEITRNPFLPVKIEGNFTLNMTTLRGIVKPILNSSLPTSTSAEVSSVYLCLFTFVYPIMSDCNVLKAIWDKPERIYKYSGRRRDEKPFGIHIICEIFEKQIRRKREREILVVITDHLPY